MIVLILDIFRLDLGEASLAFVSWQGAHRHANRTTDELGRHIDKSHRLKIFFDLLHHRHSEILVSIFTTTELELNLELVSLVEEFLGVTQLCFVIVGPDFNTELDLFHLGRAVLVLLLLLGQFVFELSKICDPANGRIGGGSDFDEVETVGLGAANGFFYSENAELLSGGADDDTHFAGANAVVDTNECWINGASVRLSARNGDDCRAEWRNCR